MDAAPSSEVKESAAEKRPIENGSGGEESEERCGKKQKVDAAAASRAELKRVAEIVLVLSTMGTMRGGRKPTDVEVDLMIEAKAKLVELCQGLAPKDIVAREAIGSVIEDLGLNAKLKDQRLGFRTPKMSIAERLSHTKWKMEEAKKFSAHSVTYTSQPLQTNIGGTVENRAPSHTVRMFPSDKLSHTATSSAGTIASTPVTHVSAASSVALPYQSTSNEVRPPMVSSGMSSGHFGRNASSLTLPKEQAQFRVDGGSNGSYPMQVQANSSANPPLVNAPTWSMQTQSASLARSGPESKVPGHTSVNVEGAGDLTVPRTAPQIARDQNFRPFITQTTPGNLSSMQQPLQGMNKVQPPSLPSHTEIAKIVQKLLQPKLPEHPVWSPPSRDYMNKALTCQMCELTVNEVDTVLLCDACEKGFHLKCLQSSVLRGIPRGEWHCMKCLTLSNGKPLPPKYGRVMRSSNTPPRVTSSTGGIQSPSEKKSGVLEPKVSQQKLTANGISAPTGAIENNYVEPPSDLKTPNTREIQRNTISSSTKLMDEKPDPNISMKSCDAASSTSAGLPGESSTQQIKVEPLANIHVEPKVLQNSSEVLSDKQLSSNLTDNSQKESHGGENLESSLTYDTKRDQQDVALANSDGGSGTNTEGRQFSTSSSDGSHVDWIGDVKKLVDDKKFYQSCRVDGVTYGLQDHVLFLSSHGKLTPSKLQSMWEDIKTGLKWVSVTKCYFPDDLPGNNCHPCISEVNEVYESNGDQTEMAASIRGPCEVLPSDKFKQETDRRSQLGCEASARLPPIFLCRWFYDEIKKLFQPVTS